MFTSATPDLESPFTQEDVLHQCLVVFGQGTDCVRVNRGAIRVFTEDMRHLISDRKLHERWETIAVQMLERIRMIGRAAAALATNDGRTVISDEDVNRAFSKVQLASKSGECPPKMTAAFPSSL